jgi:hypothetical protein
MSRPTKQDGEKLSCVLPPVRCTEEEKNIIKQKAIDAGLSLSLYIRRMAINGQITVKKDNLDLEVTHQLRKIGNNLNQQTRAMNVTGTIPHELKSVWNKLDNLITQLTTQV